MYSLALSEMCIRDRGYYEFQDGNLADWSLNGLPTLPIDYR